MGKTNDCAIFRQDTGGTLGVHTMAGRHKSVFLQVLDLVPGICLVLAQESLSSPWGPSVGGGGAII